MAWRKSPPDLMATFDAALPSDPAVERRKMFGYPCAFVNGNMFAGLWQEFLIVRLSEDDRAKAVREPGIAIFEPMKGRPMREYIALPPERTAEPAHARKWIRSGFDYAASLPAKVKKTKKAKAPKPTAKKAVRRGRA